MVDQRIEVVNAGAVDLGTAKQATEANGKLHDLDKRYLDYVMRITMNIKQQLENLLD